MLDEDTFGKRLKKLRDKSGMGQTDLAKKVGIKQSSISKYENDEVEPRASTLILLCGALGTTPNYLLLGNDDGIIQQQMTKRDAEFLSSREGICWSLASLIRYDVISFGRKNGLPTSQINIADSPMLLTFIDKLIAARKISSDVSDADYLRNVNSIVEKYSGMIELESRFYGRKISGSADLENRNKCSRLKGDLADES